jgi:hypothetical protein
MTDLHPTIKNWLKDPEFNSLPEEDRMSAIGGFFDSNLANDDFSKEPPEIQEQARTGFITSHLSAQKSAQGKSGLGALARTALRIPENVAAKGLMALQGQSGASVADRGPADRFVNWVEDRNRDLAEEYDLSGDVVPGVISKRDVAELGPNLAFSGISMGGSAAGAAGGAVAGGLAGGVGAPIGAVAGGLAGGSTAAYRMDNYQTMNDWLERVNQESISNGLGPISREQEEKFKKEFSKLATEHGLWEAGPEGIGNVLELALMTAKNLPGLRWVPRGIAGKVAKAGLRAAGILGTEQATETVTQMGQQRVESEAGMTDEPKREWTSGDDILKSAKEVLPQVLLLSGVMSGSGHAYRGIKGENQELSGTQMAINRMRQSVESGDAGIADLAKIIKGTKDVDPEIHAEAKVLYDQLKAETAEKIISGEPTRKELALLSAQQQGVQQNAEESGAQAQETGQRERPQGESGQGLRLRYNEQEGAHGGAQDETKSYLLNPAEESAAVFNREAAKEDRVRQSPQGYKALKKQLADQSERAGLVGGYLEQFHNIISSGEPGGRLRTQDLDGTEQWQGMGSTYKALPWWEDGMSKRQALKAIEWGLSGKRFQKSKLGKGMSSIWDKAIRGAKEAFANDVYQRAQDIEADPAAIEGMSPVEYKATLEILQNENIDTRPIEDAWTGYAGDVQESAIKEIASQFEISENDIRSILEDESEPGVTFQSVWDELSDADQEFMNRMAEGEQARSQPTPMDRFKETLQGKNIRYKQDRGGLIEDHGPTRGQGKVQPSVEREMPTPESKVPEPQVTPTKQATISEKERPTKERGDGARRSGETTEQWMNRLTGNTEGSKPSKADKLIKESDRLAAEADKMLERIPPGQPILSVADRNLRDRSAEKMRKASELLKEGEKLKQIESSEKPITAAKPAPDTGKVKEPWEMSLIEYAKSKLPKDQAGQIKRESQVKSFKPQYIKNLKGWIREGKPVPSEVLKEYPDLEPKPGRAENKPSTQLSVSETPQEEFKVKPPKKLYRGVKPGTTGLGVYSMGKGIYTSPDKSFAKKFGDVEEVTPTVAFPRNPLVLNNAAGGSAQALTDWILRNSEFRNIRLFNKAYADPGQFVREQGYDGVVAGDEVVKYTEPLPDKSTPQPEEGQPSPEIDAAARADIAKRHNVPPESLVFHAEWRPMEDHLLYLYNVIQPGHERHGSTLAYKPDTKETNYVTGDKNGDPRPVGADPETLRSIRSEFNNIGAKIFDRETRKRIRLELSPEISRKGKNVSESERQWVEIKNPGVIMGAATVDRLNAVIELSTAFPKPTIRKNILHEYIHAAMRWVFPESDYKLVMDEFNGNEESAAEFGANLLYGKIEGKRPAPAVMRLFRKFRMFLKRMGNVLKGKGFKTSEDVFNKLWKKGYPLLDQAVIDRRVAGDRAGVNEFAQPPQSRLSTAIKKITDNPNFRKWFGDSKVVDENGEPLVVYHGTGSNFSVFKRGDLGNHFGTVNQANQVAGFRYGSSSVIPVYLHIKNPIRLVDMGGFGASDVISQLIDMKITTESEWQKYSKNEDLWAYENEAGVIDLLKDEGYDGAIYLNRREGTHDPFGPDGVEGNELNEMTDAEVIERFPNVEDSYIAFHPTQIKSIYNTGTFDATNPDIRYQVAHHGTPHTLQPEPGYPNGRFNLDYVGTGEGGQAYGWGIYFAEKEDTAKTYTSSQATGDYTYSWKGNEYAARSGPEAHALSLVYHDGVMTARRIAKEGISAIDNGSNEMGPNGWAFEKGRDYWETMLETANSIKSKKEVTAMQGQLYQLDIPDSVIPKLLDWDKPLSEQSAYVKKALAKDETFKRLISATGTNDETFGRVEFAPATGSELYNKLAKPLSKLPETEGDQATSEYLASIGIPGNIHGGVSKGGTGAKYVIWDQKVLDKIALLKRNQKPLKAMQEEEKAARPTVPTQLSVSDRKESFADEFLREFVKEPQKAPRKDITGSEPSEPERPEDRARATLGRYFNDSMYWIVDKNRPIDTVQKYLKKKSDDMDVFLKETQRPKVTAAKVKKAWEDDVKPLLSSMAKSKVSVPELEEYKHALHAPEANDALRKANAKAQVKKIEGLLTGEENKAKRKFVKEQITTINVNGRSVKSLDNKGNRVEIVRPEDWYNALNNIVEKYRNDPVLEGVISKWESFSEKPSGMSDSDASRILEQYSGNTKIKRLGSMLDTINDKKLQLLYDSGLIDEQEYKAIKNKYKHYVPLYREGYPDMLSGPSRGIKPSGRPVKVRGGSTRNVVDIMAHSIANYEKAINLSEKARSQKALYELIKNNPESDIISISDVPKSPRYDAYGNLRMYPDMFKVAENEMGLTVDGKRHVVSVARDDKDAMLMLRTLKAEDSSTGPILNTLSKVNRFLARVNTSWSPEFIISNFVRDIQTAGINIKDTGVKNRKMLGGAAVAIKAIYNVERGKKTELSEELRQFEKDLQKAMVSKDSKIKVTNTIAEYESYYERFKAAGGKIGWADVHDSITNLSKKLTSEIEMQAGKRPVRKRLNDWLKLIEDLNTSIENGVRLHVFRLAVEQGKSDERAAQIASDLTVDFTKKGAAGPVINSLYLFANAGIQGSYRIMRAATKSKSVRKSIAGIIGAGFVAGLFNALAGGDDEDGEDYFNKIDDFIRERNMIIMLPGTGGKYAKVPLPWGYNFFWNIGSEISRAFTKEEYSPLKGAGRLAAIFANAFNPVASGTLLQTIAPTIADPIAQVAENKNWFGGELMPERDKWAKVPTPDSQRYWSTTGVASKWVAETLNKITGGDTVKPGLIDVSPETLDLIVSSVGGSAVKFGTDVFGLPLKAATGEKIEWVKIPFWRRVAGNKSQWADSKTYYENVEDVNIAKARLNAYKGTPEYRRLVESSKFEIKMMPLAKQIESRLKRLRMGLRAAKASGNKESIDAIESRIKQLYVIFNKRFYQMKKQM